MYYYHLLFYELQAILLISWLPLQPLPFFVEEPENFIKLLPVYIDDLVYYTVGEIVVVAPVSTTKDTKKM